LWLRGFNYEDDENYKIRSKQFFAFLETDFTLNDYFTFLKENDIEYFLVQYGLKRDVELRSPGLKKLMALLADYYATSPASSDYSRQQTFIGDMDGAIDIYGKKPLPY
jgi:hypothetical protein